MVAVSRLATLRYREAFLKERAALVERIVTANPVREMGYRSARGLQRVAETHASERVEAACEQALGFGARCRFAGRGRFAVMLRGSPTIRAP